VVNKEANSLEKTVLYHSWQLRQIYLKHNSIHDRKNVDTGTLKVVHCYRKMICI